jgi:actin-related protein
LIIDIGTCSIRAGLFNDEPKLPTIFQPTVCARDSNELGEFKLRIGFDAFDSVLASTAPSTIDLNKAGSMWSLNSTTSISGAGNHLIHPLKNKKAIDKLNMDIGSIDAIIEFVVDSLNVQCNNHQIVVITPQKFSDKINVQFLNLLLVNEKYQFESATLMNQTLMALYSYNSTVGVVVNLGEKIDIVPICNVISFQSGVSNLAYGGSRMF